MSELYSCYMSFDKKPHVIHIPANLRFAFSEEEICFPKVEHVMQRLRERTENQMETHSNGAIKDKEDEELRQKTLKRNRGQI